MATGAVVQRMDYDEFGNVIFDTAPASSLSGLPVGSMIRIPS